MAKRASHTKRSKKKIGRKHAHHEMVGLKVHKRKAARKGKRGRKRVAKR